MKLTDVLTNMIGAREPNCPNEADFLAYSEGTLSTRRRAQIERHFADCDDCRQGLAFLGRESEGTAAPLTEEAVSAQTDRVLAYIQRDEQNRSKPAKKARAAAGFYISYPRLASVGLIICALAIGGIFMITRDQSPAEAMAALRLAVKDARYTEGRISRLDYSRYAGTTRGGDGNSDALHFDRAENKVKAAAQEPAADEARLVWARICLARGTREDAKRALSILGQLTKSAIDTPEALNDTGVAYLQLANYPEAITYFSEALTKSPRYDDALFNKALAEEGAHRYDDAKRDWQTFIDQSADDGWKNEAREHLKRLNEPIR